MMNKMQAASFGFYRERKNSRSLDSRNWANENRTRVGSERMGVGLDIDEYRVCLTCTVSGLTVGSGVKFTGL